MMFLNDLQHAWRRLMRFPVFSIICIASLSIAIGANVAIYALVDHTLLRPLPFSESERLVKLWQVHPAWSSRIPISVPTYLDWRQRSFAFQDMSAFAVQPSILFGNDFPSQRLDLARVSPNLLPMLGLNPQLGSHFSPALDGLGLKREVLLGHALWQGLFGAREDIVGRGLNIDGLDYQIAGVLPPGPAYPPGLSKPLVDLWIPLIPEGEERSDRDRFFLNALARLRPGQSTQDALSELTGLAEALAAEHPESESLQPGLATLQAEWAGSVRPALLVFWAAVGFVLLLACINIVSLMLAQGDARRSELAMRAALGAGRTRLLFQLLTESLLVAVLGGAAALALSSWGVRMLMAFYPGDLPQISPTVVDSRIAVFALALSIACGLVLGIFPAISALRGSTELGTALRSGAGWRSSLAGVRPLTLLAGIEIALAIVLSCGAGLSLSSFWNLLRVERGFQANNVAVARIWLPQQQFSDAATQRAFYEAFLEQSGALPGVLSVGAIQTAPLGAGRWSSYFRAQGLQADEEHLPTADFRVVLGDYFKTMGIAVLRGRGFREGDALGSAPVAVINETLANRVWPGGDPLGLLIAPTGAEGDDSWATIVGIVRDIKQNSLREAPRAAIYRPWRQHPVRDMDVVVRAERDILALTPALRSLLHGLDPKVPALNLDSLESRVDSASARERFALLLLGSFALTALALGVAGTYGVASFSVAQRDREIGIRMAIGADQSQIRRMFLRQGGVLIAVASSAGLLASIGLTRAMRSMLFQVSPLDPTILALSVLTVSLAALAAVWIPSLRASAIDPMRTLNSQ